MSTESESKDFMCQATSGETGETRSEASLPLQTGNSADEERPTRRAPHMERYVVIRPQPSEDEPDRYQMRLEIGNQGFQINGGPGCENEENALWMRDMLCIALDNLVKLESQAEEPASAGDTERPASEAGSLTHQDKAWMIINEFVACEVIVELEPGAYETLLSAISTALTSAYEEGKRDARAEDQRNYERDLAELGHAESSLTQKAREIACHMFECKFTPPVDGVQRHYSSCDLLTAAISTALSSVQTQEREACAKVADRYAEESAADQEQAQSEGAELVHTGAAMRAMAIADFIRSRRATNA